MFVVLTVCLVLGHTGRLERGGSCVSKPQDSLATVGLRPFVRVACRGVLRGGLRLRHARLLDPSNLKRIIPTKETAGAAVAPSRAHGAPSLGSPIWVGHHHH